MSVNSWFDLDQIKKFEEDLKSISNEINNIATSHPTWVTNELKKSMISIRNEIIQSMRDTPKTGNHYDRGGGKIHIASSPGNPPAIDYGELVKSIHFDVRDMEAEIGAKAQHGLYMEEGTKRVAKRPFLETERIDKELNKLADRIGEITVETIARPFGIATTRSTRLFGG